MTTFLPFEIFTIPTIKEMEINREKHQILWVRYEGVYPQLVFLNCHSPTHIHSTVVGSDKVIGWTTHKEGID